MKGSTLSKFERMFLKMKDQSELMVDLAYTALLYNDKEIAEEVYDLEESFDKLYDSTVRYAVSKLAGENEDMALVTVKLATSLETIADSAKEIADVVLRDIEPHPILKKSIKKSDSAIFKVKVAPNSIMANQTIGAIGIAQELGTWIIAIKRSNKWVFGPNSSVVIKSMDRLIARGPFDAKKKFKRLAKGKLRTL